ncbi:MAG: hypothetical protein JWO37_3954 [Acidimicrobiales bacterium]|nr:hypothetical protein [Acidimicrobiales bacterium]
MTAVRPRASAVLLAAIVALLAACSGSHSKALPPAPAVDETTTTLPDYSKVGLGPVTGRTTTTIDNRPGSANLSGTVAAGLDGPVGAAVVRVQRLVGDAVVQTDVATNPDGTWALPNVQGGRYRIRAWRAPDLALVEPVVLFIGATEARSVPISVGRFTGVSAVASIAPNPPVVGDPANLVVQARTQAVDAEGVVRASPLPGATLELSGSAAWSVASGGAVTADGQGVGRWEVHCTAAGPQPLSVTVNGTDSFPLNLAACTEPTTTTTAGAPPTT